MKIYKVRMYINRHKRNGDIEHITHREQLYIDNPTSAKYCFSQYKNEAAGYSYLAGYSGAVELFIPHIHDDGMIAYFPAKDNYLDRYDFGK